jgi:hypothetical protein
MWMKNPRTKLLRFCLPPSLRRRLPPNLRSLLCRQLGRPRRSALQAALATQHDRSRVFLPLWWLLRLRGHLWLRLGRCLPDGLLEDLVGPLVEVGRSLRTFGGAHAPIIAEHERSGSGKIFVLQFKLTHYRRKGLKGRWASRSRKVCTVMKLSLTARPPRVDLRRARRPDGIGCREAEPLPTRVNVLICATRSPRIDIMPRSRSRIFQPRNHPCPTRSHAVCSPA